MLQHAIRAAIILPVFVTALVLSGGCGADPAGAISDVPVGSLQDDGVEPVVASETEEVPIGQPSAVIQANPSVGVAPLSVGLTTAGSSGGAGPIDTYSWQFDDGSFGSGPILYRTFAEPGVRTVALTVTDTYGATATAVKEVYVLPTFVIDTDPQDAAGAAPMTVAFSANTLTSIPDLPIDYALQWQFGDGESAEGWDVMHTYQQAGSYVATLTLVLATMSIDCAEQEVRVVQGDQTAAVVANAGGDQTVSPGTVVTLDGSGSRSGGDLGLMYTWAQTLGPAVTLSDPHAVAPTFEAPAVDEPTTLVFLLTVTDGQNPADDSVTITIVPSAPLLPPVANAGDDLVLPDGDRSGNENVTLDGSNSYDADGEIVQYLWMSGDTVLADGGNPQAEVALPVGEHVLTLIVRDNDDLTDSDNVTITITDGAALAVTPPSDFISSGTVGGPFVPAYKSYAVHNTGDEPLAWSAAKTQPWVSLSQTSGVLGAGESVTVVVTPNDAATELPPGEYSDPHITFTNETNGDGNTERSAALTVVEATMTTASRTTGVAPLAVFFDAVDTATPAWDSGVVQPADGDYASYHYEWDFGDPGSGNWTTGRQNPDGSYPSRNEATGYVAAHVYEQPGTYAVTLRVLDTAGDWHEYVQEVTVTAEPPGGWTTYYVSSSHPNASDSNLGTDENEPLETFAAAMTKLAPHVRVLFRRGDVFEASSPFVLSANGPILIGAYGTGAKPVLESNLDASLITITGSSITLQDIRFVQVGVMSQNWASVTLSNSVTTQDVLYLRLEAEDWRTGFGMGDNLMDPHRNWIIAGCRADVGPQLQYGLFGAGYHIAVLGNVIANTYTHNVRLSQAIKAVVAHNELGYSELRGGLKIHSPYHDSGKPETYAVVVSNNDIIGGTYLLEFGAADNVYDIRSSNCVIERNSFRGSSACVNGVWLSGQHVTVRNNTWDWTGASYFNGVAVYPRGVDGVTPPPDDIRVYNNTAYRGDAGTFYLLNVTEGSGSVYVYNNVGFAPQATEIGLIWGDDSTVVADDNLIGVATDPLFMDPQGMDFRLQTGSPAVDMGRTLVEVRSDMLGASRVDQSFDLGAFESW